MPRLLDLLQYAAGEGTGSLHSALGRWRQEVSTTVDQIATALGLTIGADGSPILQGGTGLLAAGEFFALMPGDNAATIGIGAPVLFPQNGPAFGGIARSGASPSDVLLPAIGIYEVSFQASIAEPGQLMLKLNGVELAPTVAGRATGTSQISNTVLIQTTVPNSILQVVNPSGNAAALTMTPTAGGTHAVSATLTILRVQ